VDPSFDLHAKDHVLRKGFVESCFPSGFAPKLTTLIDAAFEVLNKKLNVAKNRKIMLYFL
jgi:hypothetical protein